jgi:hypothetical protein
MHELLAQGYITSKDSPEKCYIPKEMKQQKKVETSKAGGWKSTIAPPKACFWQATRFLSIHFGNVPPTHVGLIYCKARGKIDHKWEGSYAYS